ncbi:hypothetical protein LTR08_009108 [Meristemomyces frigidus]|nr:hypothetical protein LTR08_009108 [Meristemomyces frigidus]
MGRLHYSFSPPPHSRASHFLDVQLANGSGLVPPCSSSSHSRTSSQYLPPAISPLRLPPVDDSTQVQLQRQRSREQHSTVLVSKTIPGFKTSAAFFASLRTNLRLHASPPPSPMSTPPSMRGSATSLPPPSPLSQAVDYTMADTDSVPPHDSLAGVPELRTYMTNDEDDKISALKLAADSIAQMRQAANYSLISHPLNMTIAVAVLALVARYMVESRQDTYLAGTTCAGFIMAALAAFRYLTKGYLFAAEDISWDWLGDADIIITKFGEEVIGTVMIDWVSGESRQKRKKAWRGEVVAWTVKMKYRKKGVGSALLEEAVKEAKKKGAETIEFAEDHANSKRILPSLYNGVFDRRERKARELLLDLLQTSPGRGKRK